MKKIKYISLAMMGFAFLAATTTLTSCGDNKEKTSHVVKENYTITFESVGGSKVDPKDIKAGDKIGQLPNITKPGFLFGGWYLESTCSTKVTSDFIVNEDLTLYALWNDVDIQTCTLTFNTMGGSTIESVKVEVNSKATQPNQPVKEGYTFIGWFKDENCSVSFSFDEKLSSDTTIYASWEKTEVKVNTYTISFDTAGGSQVASVKVEENGVINAPATNPTKDDYKFIGWYEQDLTTPFDFTKPVTADTTVYAKWEQIERFNVTFNTDGGSAVTQLVVEKDSTISEPTTLPTKDGYKFLGWYEQDLTTPFDFTKPITADTTVYAKWEVRVDSKTIITNKTPFYTEDFTTTTSLTTWSDGVELGCYKQTNKKTGDQEDYTGNDVIIADGVATLNDTTSSSTRLITDFGKDYTSGKVYVYFDITLENSANSWTFIQFFGDSFAKNNEEVFGIRADSGIMKYREDSGNSNTPNASVSVGNQNYKMLFEFDLEAQTVKITVNNQYDIIINLTNNISALSSVRFVSSDSGNKTLSLNEIILAHEEADLATVKQKKLDQLATYYGYYDLNAYQTNGTKLTEAYNKAKQDVNAATTADAVCDAYKAGINAMNSIPRDDEIQLFTAREAKIAEFKALYDANDYSFNPDFETTLNKCIEKINAATLDTLDTVTEAQKTVMNGVLKNDAYLAKYKDDKKSELSSYKDITLYTINGESVQSCLTTANGNIDACLTPSEIDTIVTNTKASLDLIKSDTEEVDAAKASAVLELNTYFTQNAPEDNTSSSYIQLNALLTEGITAINEKTSLEDIASAKNSALQNMTDYIALTSVTVDEAKSSAITKLTNYIAEKKALYDAESDQALFTQFDNVLATYTENINAQTTNSDIADTLNEGQEAIDALITKDTLTKAKIVKVNELTDYYNTLKADLELEDALTQFESEYQTQVEAINSVEVIDNLNSQLEDSKAALDSKKEDCVALEKANRVQYEMEMEVGVDTKVKFGYAENGYSKSTELKDSLTLGPFTITPGGKTQLKTEGLSIKGGTITFTTTQENALLTICYYSASGGRYFTLDGVSYEPNTFPQDLSNNGYKTTTITIATIGTHTMTFDSNEHKIEYCTLNEKRTGTYTGYVNSLDFTCASDVTTTTDVNSVVSNVTLDIDILEQHKTAVVTTGYTIVITKDGEVVTSFAEAGEYTILVYYGTTATKYNSKSVKVTVTQGTTEGTTPTTPDSGDTPTTGGTTEGTTPTTPDSGDTPTTGGTTEGTTPTTPDSGDTPTTGETTPDSGDTPTTGETTPDSGDTPTTGETTPDSGDTPTTGETTPDSGDTQTPTTDDTSSNN